MAWAPISSSTDIIFLSLNLFKSEFLNIPIKCQKLSIKNYNSRRLLWAFKFCSKKLDELYCVGPKYFLLQNVQCACMIAIVMVIVKICSGGGVVVA